MCVHEMTKRARLFKKKKKNETTQKTTKKSSGKGLGLMSVQIFVVKNLLRCCTYEKQQKKFRYCTYKVTEDDDDYIFCFCLCLFLIQTNNASCSYLLSVGQAVAPWCKWSWSTWDYGIFRAKGQILNLVQLHKDFFFFLSLMCHNETQILLFGGYHH